MSNEIIRFPGVRIERHSDTEPGEGYRLKHMDFEDINEPTSSNPFPWVKVVENKLRIQAAHDFFQDLDLTPESALDLATQLTLAARRMLR